MEYLMRVITFSVSCLLFCSGCLISSGSAAEDSTTFPNGLQAGKCLFHAAMDSPKSVDRWRMEGPGEVSFKDRWMHMRSPDEEMHHVFWCPER
jgi:hypothetical protein